MRNALEFVWVNILIAFIVGILASYLASRLFLYHLITSKPAVKIYSYIVKTQDDPHFFVVLFSNEKEILNLKADVLLYKEVENKVYTIPIPLWRDGDYPLSTKPKLVLPIKLNKIFFNEIQRQQGTYRFISENLRKQLDQLIDNIGKIEEYDNFPTKIKKKTIEIFSKLVTEYGAVRIIINLDHKASGLRKKISRSVTEVEKIKDWDIINRKRYSEISKGGQE